MTELHIVDPFDKSSPIKNKKHFKYDVFYDDESKLQIVEMQLRSRWESFSFILKGEASNELYLNEFIDYEEQKIYLDKNDTFVKMIYSQLKISSFDMRQILLKTCLSHPSIFNILYRVYRKLSSITT